VCTYGANQVPDAVLDGVWRTHPEVAAGEWRKSDRFEDPRELMRNLTSQPEPLPDLRPLSVGADLEVFRERLARELMAEKVPDARALDMLVAATEMAANALRHGGGIAEVRVGRAQGRFVCEVLDRGSGFDDPVAGYLAPRAGAGTGLWIARRLAWRLELFRSPQGFTARIWL
jgi:anti-sigma regulatory factor (Ser/Thr protein kinase)